MAIELAGLTEFHNQFQDSVRWKLTPAGLLIEGEAAPAGSGGLPKTMGRVWTNFGAHIQATAKQRDVPCELIMATIGAESSGDPTDVREEPGYVSDEETPDKVSPGLMQTLISTAREATGNRNLSRADLFKPEISIDAGTAYIAKHKKNTHFDPPVVACAYNAGSVRENKNAANRWRMVQFPINTSKHADRWVGWFNDCFLLFAADAAIRPAADTPSFFRDLNP